MKVNLRIHTKLMIAIILPLVIIYFSVIGWLVITNKNYDLDDARIIADSYSSSYANMIKSDLDYEIGIIRGVRNSLEGFSRKPFEEIEWDMIPMLETTLKNRDEFLSTWISWELSAIDPGYKSDYGRVRYIFTKEEQSITCEIDTLNLEGDDLDGVYYRYKTNNSSLIDNPYQFVYGSIGEFYVSSIGIPINDSEGRFSGLVGVDLDVERFNRMIDTINPFGGYAFIITNDGYIVAHPDRQILGKSFFQLNQEEESRLNISRKVAAGENFSFYTFVTWDGRKRYVTFAPIALEGIDSPWSLGIVVPVTNIMARANSNFTISIVLGLLSFIMMSVIIWFLSKNITRPLQKTTAVLTKLSRGELSDIEPIRIESHDEVARMSSELNVLTRNLKRIADFAIKIGEGDLGVVYKPIGDHDMLGMALVKMQQDLVETNEKLERSIEKAVSATNAKSIFLANMSHEIRTPLNGIIGMTDMLRAGNLTSTQKEYLDIIEVSGNNLLSIINDILDFSKIESGQIEIEQVNLNLRNEIKQVIRLLEIKAEKKSIFIRTEIEEALPEYIIGDPLRIKQVLVNLVNNAIKFTEKGGITISVTQVKRGRKNIRVLFRVTDTGIGISGEGMKRLFKSFSQTDISTTRKYGGTGLGLAISKKLVELMSGTIGVESEVDKGSTFWFNCKFRLPTDHEMVAEESKDDHGSQKSGKLSILLAEDNRINQKVVSLILAKMGHEVEVAENGVKVLDMLRSKKYDLILMDVQMPEMDGIEATERIRKDEILQDKAVRIPIIALTANALMGDRERFLEAGMDAYLSKPFKPAELEVIMNNLDINKLNI